MKSFLSYIDASEDDKNAIKNFSIVNLFKVKDENIKDFKDEETRNVLFIISKMSLLIQKLIELLQQKSYYMTRTLKLIKQAFTIFELFQYANDIKSKDFIYLLDNTKFEKFHSGHIVYQQNDKAKMMHILMKGFIFQYVILNQKVEFFDLTALEIDQNTKNLLINFNENMLSKNKSWKLKKIIFPGQSYGEIPLVQQVKRKETSVVCGECQCLAFFKKDLDYVLTKYHNKKLKDQTDFIRKICIFKDLPKYMVMAMIQNQNQIIFKEEEKCQYVYLLKKGQVQISKMVDTEDQDAKLQEIEKFNRNSVQKNSLKIRQRIQMVIITENQIFGQEEINENIGVRNTRAECISSTVEVVMIEKEEFLHILKQQHLTVTLKANQADQSKIYEKQQNCALKKRCFSGIMKERSQEIDFRKNSPSQYSENIFNPRKGSKEAQKNQLNQLQIPQNISLPTKLSITDTDRKSDKFIKRASSSYFHSHNSQLSPTKSMKSEQVSFQVSQSLIRPMSGSQQHGLSQYSSSYKNRSTMEGESDRNMMIDLEDESTKINTQTINRHENLQNLNKLKQDLSQVGAHELKFSNKEIENFTIFRDKKMSLAQFEQSPKKILLKQQAKNKLLNWLNSSQQHHRNSENNPNIININLDQFKTDMQSKTALKKVNQVNSHGELLKKDFSKYVKMKRVRRAQKARVLHVSEHYRSNSQNKNDENLINASKNGSFYQFPYSVNRKVHQIEEQRTEKMIYQQQRDSVNQRPASQGQNYDFRSNKPYKSFN